MKKLKLDLNDLKVESFETAQIPTKVGTIQGHQDAIDTEPPNNPCGGGGGGTGVLTYCLETCTEVTVNDPTCVGVTCNDTCGWSCYGTCDYTCSMC